MKLVWVFLPPDLAEVLADIAIASPAVTVAQINREMLRSPVL